MLAAAATAGPVFGALAAACDLPKGLMRQKEVVRLAVPSGAAAYDDVAAAVERAAALAGSAPNAPFTIQTVRVPLPGRPSGGQSPFVQAATRLLAQQPPIDLLLVVSRSNDMATPAGDVQDLLNLQLLAPLDEHLKSDKMYRAGEFYPAALDALRHKGRAYAQPLTVEPVVLYYDPDLFASSGVRPPDSSWNWQVLRESARRLTREAPDGQMDQWALYAFPPYWLLMTLIWQNGGDLVTRDGKAAAIAEPAAVEALQYFYDLAAVHRVAPPPPVFGRSYEYSLRFQDGKIYAGGRARVAMGLGPGAANLRQVLADFGLPDVRLGLAYAEAPQGKQRATGLRVSSALAITAKAASSDVAYQALAAIEREASRNVPLAARKATPEQLRQIEASLSAAQATALVNSLGYARVARLDNVPAAQQLVLALWQTAIGGMFTGKLTAAEAAQATAKQIDALLAR